MSSRARIAVCCVPTCERSFTGAVDSQVRRRAWTELEEGSAESTRMRGNAALKVHNIEEGRRQPSGSRLALGVIVAACAIGRRSRDG
jgi:hypothetical protein